MNTTLSGSPDKRRRRSRAAVDALEAEILDVLNEDHPQSIRHIFYRLTDPRLPEPVEKTDRGYAQVQHRITEMRRAGRLPYDWITDSTRIGWHVPTYGNAAEYLESVAGLYRQNLWADASYHVEVWVESRSIAGVLMSTCRELAVSLYPCGGFASITLAYEAAQTINEIAIEYEKTPVIWFIGDYDPAGVLIDQALEAELRVHLHPTAWEYLHFERIGITPEQIAEYDLPTKPRKPGDRRRLDVEHTVEAEAMPAGVLRSIVRNAVEKCLPADAFRVAKVAEAEERRALTLIADAMAGGAR